MTTPGNIVRAAAASFLISIGSAAFAADLPVHNETFALSLPTGYSEFVSQVQTTKSGEGEIQTTNWVSKSGATGEALIATMSKMPAKILDPQKLIDSTRDSLLKTLKATIESEQQAPGDPASTVMLFHSDAAWFRARFTVINDRFYQLLYVGRSADQRNAATVGQMFDTFQIAPPPPAVASTAPPTAPTATTPAAAAPGTTETLTTTTVQRTTTTVQTPAPAPQPQHP